MALTNKWQMSPVQRAVLETIEEHGPIATKDIYAFVPDHDPDDVVLSVRRLSGWKIKKHSRDPKTGATIWMALRSG